MKATFSNTVDILVKAYLNDTLQHSNCYACAVGNLVADAMGYKYCGSKKKARGLTWEGFNGYDGLMSDDLWVRVFYTRDFSHEQVVNISRYDGRRKEQIDTTGYSLEELIKIEHAFETGWKGKDKMFNALLSVVDVLASIHNVDLSVKESAKQLFVKA